MPDPLPRILSPTTPLPPPYHFLFICLLSCKMSSPSGKCSLSSHHHHLGQARLTSSRSHFARYPLVCSTHTVTISHRLACFTCFCPGDCSALHHGTQQSAWYTADTPSSLRTHQQTRSPCDLCGVHTLASVLTTHLLATDTAGPN